MTPSLPLRLLAPDAATRLLWLGTASLLEGFDLANDDERLVYHAYAALGLCLGYPFAGHDVIAYGRSVSASVALRADAEVIGAAVMSSITLIEGRAEVAPKWGSSQRAERPPKNAELVGNEQVLPVVPVAPLPDGASTADIALHQLATYSAKPSAAARWNARAEELREARIRAAAASIPIPATDGWADGGAGGPSWTAVDGELLTRAQLDEEVARAVSGWTLNDDVEPLLSRIVDKSYDRASMALRKVHSPAPHEAHDEYWEWADSWEIELDALLELNFASREHAIVGWLRVERARKGGAVDVEGSESYADKVETMERICAGLLAP